MAIRSFDVSGRKGLRRAAASDLGNLVVIAGPNGAGKSSVLDEIRRRRNEFLEPGSRLMFVGPHRTWRSSSLNKVSLYGLNVNSYAALLESDNLPNYQYGPPPGLQTIQGQPRDSSSADDAQAFVKTSLGRLLDRQQQLVTGTWRANDGTIAAGEVPDLFEPFRRLIATLLPHLDWAGVDDSDQNNIQVLFRTVGNSGQQFDIDQLSSGEKAAVALLLPLVEGQSDALVEPTQADLGVVPVTMLLDEPELHLHPLLQLQVLEYLRDLATRDEAQFIITTHSPTLLDALQDDELYLLSPASLAADNQLTRLTNSYERLEVARDITGSTHLLTRAKPIVFIEGEEERPGINADARLISNLLPQTASWALVPGRSKNDVTSAVSRLRDDGLDLPGTPVFGLVDADRDETTDNVHVIAWPVAMIENFLLDASAIYEVLRPFGAQTKALSLEVVVEALKKVTEERVDDEIRLRVQRSLPVGRLALRPDDLGDVRAVAKSQTDKWLARIADLDVSALTQQAEADVKLILNEGRALERFHGKKLLHAVFAELDGQGAGISKAAFALMLSTHSGSRARASYLAEPSLNRIRLFFPQGLLDFLVVPELSGNADAANLAVKCRAELHSYDSGTPTGSNREELRQQLFGLARCLDVGQRSALVRLAAQIGTE